jgi:hypothetical protein
VYGYFFELITPRIFVNHNTNYRDSYGSNKWRKKKNTNERKIG